MLLCSPSPPLPGGRAPDSSTTPWLSGAPSRSARPRTGCLNTQAVQGDLRRAGVGLARGMLALLLLPGKRAPQPCAPHQQQAAAASALGSLLEEGCFYQPHVQTYFVVTGDVTLSLQPLQVVLALVVGPQVRVMQALVFCAQQAAVRISQIEITRGLVKL